MQPTLFIPMGRAGGVLFRGLMVRWLVLIVGVNSVLIALLFVPGVGGRAEGWLHLVANGACICAGWLMYWWAARRLVCAEYRMCLHCRRRLPGGADLGRCPECGANFDVAETREEFEAVTVAGDPRTPRIVRRYRVLGLLGGAMMTAAAMVMMVGFRKLYFTAAFGGMMGAGMLAVVTGFVFERRLLERIRRGNLLVCPRCEYSLENAGEHGVCPECGAAFDIEQVRKDWVRCLKRWEK